MTDVVILAAKRTPIGRFLGGLADVSAVELGIAAGEAALANIDRNQIDQVIIGNVLSAGSGMNVARQIGVGLTLPIATPAFTVNMMCASGLQSVLLAAQAIRAGAANCVLCGGVESMSQAPYLLQRARAGYKFGDGTLVDSILRDGLVDAFDHRHMALTAEALATEFNISRDKQDAFALQSQQRTATAMSSQIFDAEIVPVKKLVADEHPRGDTTLERLVGLKPAFDPAGTVTAGNASGINDGAAVLVLAEAQWAAERGYRPMARFIEGTTVGCDPQRMGLGPVHALQKLFTKTNGRVEEQDWIEINEAFAAQALACCQQMNLDPARINPHGGAIALGHPIGMSGARLAVHIAHQLAAGKTRRGYAALCVGGGMGIAARFDAV
ncbi:MAG TPA: acetyl-CoA C-acyltransferase [Planctomycetaceae bacterium]|nr:acetyl-CoA C-acyltransferase [Planctomycetaceae bacterium]